MNKHNPYFKKYIYSLVLDNKVSKAINIININKDKDNSKFFEAYLLLTLNNLKRNLSHCLIGYIHLEADFYLPD